MTLDAVPPGQQPTRTTPSAISAGNENALVSSNASSGMTTNCAAQPAITSLGRENTVLKSDGLSVKPMPSMTTPSIGLMMDGDRNEKYDGKYNANTALSKIMTPMNEEMRSQMRFTMSFTLFTATKIRQKDVRRIADTA